MNFVAELVAATLTLHVALRFADGLLAPIARDDVVDDRARRREVQRHGRELQRRAALEEQHLVVRRHARAARAGPSPAAPRTAMNALPRWLISITDMPLPCQSSSSACMRSSTACGSIAGTGTEVIDALHRQGPPYPCRIEPAAVNRRAHRLAHRQRHRLGASTGPSTGPPSSSGNGSTREMPTRRSASSSRISVTPCVLRPTCEISADARAHQRAGRRSASARGRSPSCIAPTSAPLRSRGLDARSRPGVPRPLRGYSSTSVRLP